MNDISTLLAGLALVTTTFAGGVAAYEGRELDAPWRAEAEQRIAEHRRGPLTIRVIDADGNPLAGVPVRVEQTQHDFGFGSAIDSYLYLFGSPRHPEMGGLYRQLAEDVFRFNEVVFEGDMKQKTWNQYKQGDHRNNQLSFLDATLTRLEQRGVRVRGHYLIQGMVMWGNNRWGFTDYRAEFDADRSTLEERLIAEAAERAEYFGDRVVDWDVINHTAGWYRNWAWRNRTGEPDFGVEWVKRLRKVVPEHVEFYFNEGNILSSNGDRADAYFEVTTAHLDGGAPIDGVGFMGHFKVDSKSGEFDTGPLTPPARQYEIMDRFANLGLDLKVTEFDVDAGTDEQLQADFLRDSMIVAFSHPSMKAFVMWGFWEAKHWRPAAALTRRDGSIKPAGQAYLDLVFDAWWTDEEVATSSEGTIEILAFYGDYTLTATVDGKPVVLELTHTRDAPADAVLQAE
ncbi:MAG: endo-1,4-beta-xylanase [Planctomycetota bacterium]